MICRDMKMADVEAVHEVEVSAFPDPWSLASFKNEMKNKLAKYIVAEDDDGKIVGYIGVWYIIDEAHINNVAVHKDYRGKHIGSMLMEYLIKRCEEDSIDSITLEVRSSNEIAQNLYRKYGFKPGGIRKEYYSDNREDAIIMWKQIREVK